ncbi:MAG TPA: ring-opening amidohydrolase [Micropepsaceae bacterium]|nr:ring-opening amidohydrolase [Micropepsaceae bacterium]
MAVDVVKFELASPQDVSGLEACFKSGRFSSDSIVALIGKTEGNGGVNDFSRALADLTYRRALRKAGTRSREEIAAIPMVWSGGCDGVICPHATVFARNAVAGDPDESRLAIGGAISEEILPEDIGRPAMIEKLAAGVQAAMRDAGIEDRRDVHYVQTKTPLLTVNSAADAERRGQTVACRVQESSGISNGTSALGVAVGLGEIVMPRADQICRDLSLYSSVASCSSGVEFSRAQIVLLGNRKGAGGRYRIGHALMADMLDMDGVYGAIRNAGLELPDRPRADDIKGRLVAMFIKCEPNRNAKLRGRRQVMFNDSDIPYHRHAKAAVGGAVTAAIGDPAVFISVDAMHSGPHGSGPVAAIVDLGP